MVPATIPYSTARQGPERGTIPLTYRVSLCHQCNFHISLTFTTPFHGTTVYTGMPPMIAYGITTSALRSTLMHRNANYGITMSWCHSWPRCFVFPIMFLPYPSNHATPPSAAATPLQLPLYCNHQLTVHCCVAEFNGGHLKPRTHLLSSYSGAPNKLTNHGATQPDNKCLVWDHKGPRRHELMSLLTNPWWERDKPLGGRVVVAHLGCCALLCCWCVPYF